LSISSFRVAFEGEPFDDGEIDVNDLAPALLALGEVIQAANRVLNGDRAKASLKLRASNQGSFEALLSIDVSIVNAIRDMLDVVADNPERIVAADQLLGLLFKGVTVVGVPLTGLFGVIKWLRGRKAEKVADRGDGTTSITMNQTTVIIDKRTEVLLRDPATREALETFGERALRVPGLTTFRIGEMKSEDEVVFTNNDVAAFKVPEQSNDEPIIKVVEREVLLKIVTSHFRDGYKWRFSDGGEKPFTANMEDADFLRDVQDGKTTLSANDTLRCLVREEQRLTSAGLAKDVTIIRVVEHIEGARQLRLF
jgi:hypothetical protein